MYKLKNNRENWLKQLSDVITDCKELLRILEIDVKKYNLFPDISKKEIFPCRVPRTFVQRMTKKNPNDPLFLQIFINIKEFDYSNANYKKNPLKEDKNIVVPGLIHKYKNRALLITKNSCAINCRYCFRRYFPYAENKGDKKNWKNAIDYLKKNKKINEIILSGGDPLMAKDHEIKWLIEHLEYVDHIQRVRIHTRLPVVIPSRITHNLCKILKSSRFKIILVTHINHYQEFDNFLSEAINKLKESNIILLNQSVLLKNINNDANILENLSNKLIENNIIPYYLHILDKVQGTSHFYVSVKEAKKIFKKLSTMVSGYMLPKLVIDTPNSLSKHIL